MTVAPSALQQVLLLVLFVLPGISYQFVRERLHGPVPGERDLSERVLRAVTASIALDGLYLLVAGPQIVSLVKTAHHPWFDTAGADPRRAAAVGLTLFLAAPAAAAWAAGAVRRRRSPARYRPAPTAWDAMLRDRGPGFVRLRLKSGAWAGGWYGKRSHASAYPHPADLFLESAYTMAADGSFGPRAPSTGGLYLRMSDVEVLEFIRPAETSGHAGVVETTGISVTPTPAMPPAPAGPDREGDPHAR
jgi:hypothetical protein